jgi:hypothetical protein
VSTVAVEADALFAVSLTLDSSVYLRNIILRARTILSLPSTDPTRGHKLCGVLVTYFEQMACLDGGTMQSELEQMPNTSAHWLIGDHARVERLPMIMIDIDSRHKQHSHVISALWCEGGMNQLEPLNSKDHTCRRLEKQTYKDASLANDFRNWIQLLKALYEKDEIDIDDCYLFKSLCYRLQKLDLYRDDVQGRTKGLIDKKAVSPVMQFICQVRK